jgi:PilZ domain-containing protein
MHATVPDKLDQTRAWSATWSGVPAVTGLSRTIRSIPLSARFQMVDWTMRSLGTWCRLRSHLGSQIVSLELEEKEFVALDGPTIKRLLSSGEQESRSRRKGVERRKEERWPFPAAVQLWATNYDGEEYEYLATCENLNEQGIGLTTDRSFEPGSNVGIAIHQCDATYHGRGIIRHCTRSDRGYFVGVELVESAG